MDFTYIIDHYNSTMLFYWNKIIVIYKNKNKNIQILKKLFLLNLTNYLLKHKIITFLYKLNSLTNNRYSKLLIY